MKWLDELLGRSKTTAVEVEAAEKQRDEDLVTFRGAMAEVDDLKNKMIKDYREAEAARLRKLPR